MSHIDSLHVPSERLVVYYNDNAVLMLNKRLLDSQNCWTNLEAIKEKHEERLDLEHEMKKTNDPGLLKLFDALYTLIEFELQDLWGFSKDIRFHRFWYRPKCSCPSLDNADNYPHGYYVVNGNCPLHGE